MRRFCLWKVVLMRISFSPQRRHDALTVFKSDDKLTVNGKILDFSNLPNGATLPAEAIDSEWITRPAERIDGDIHLTLLLPHGPKPSQAVAFPQPITVTANGPITVPHDPDPEPEEA